MMKSDRGRSAVGGARCDMEAYEGGAVSSQSRMQAANVRQSAHGVQEGGCRRGWGGERAVWEQLVAQRDERRAYYFKGAVGEEVAVVVHIEP
jgi:hypothetical protein